MAESLNGAHGPTLTSSSPPAGVSYSSSQVQLWKWQLKLNRLTNSFVDQSSLFFRHCRQMERQFVQRTLALDEEKRRVAEKENLLTRILSSIESFLHVDIPIDELYSAPPDPGTDVDPFILALTRRLAQGLDSDYIADRDPGSNLRSRSPNFDQGQPPQYGPNIVHLQAENAEKSLQITNLLGQIKDSEEKEKRLELLAEKFSALALEFEKIFKDSSKVPDFFSGFNLNLNPNSTFDLDPSSTSDLEQDEEPEDKDENDWNDLMSVLEKASSDLQSYCNFRRSRQRSGSSQFERNYPHFQKSLANPSPLNDFLQLVESEFVHLWKREDRRESAETAGNSNVSSQTEDFGDTHQNQGNLENLELENQRQILLEERVLLDHKSLHLSKMEKSLELRESELRLQESNLKQRMNEFSREKIMWESCKQNDMKQMTGQGQGQKQSARSSMSLNDLVDKGQLPVNSEISLPLPPPPDLKASSFDRQKRFPHFHLLRDRFEEISNCAKTSSLQSGFSRHHFYLGKMTDIVNYFKGHGDPLLSEQLEAQKFVSVVKAYYGVNPNEGQICIKSLSGQPGKIIAIGFGSTALEATEKAVQMTHDALFTGEKSDSAFSPGESPCLVATKSREILTIGPAGDSFDSGSLIEMD